jgi:ABC-2 type transport system permease protein
MRNTWIIFKREFRSYFDSPVAYIVISIFLILIGWFFFSPFFIANRATMRDFFILVPIMYLFFAPAVAMRLIAEEKRSGTIEILITLPVRDQEVILGKYFASLALLLVALILTLPFPITVSYLGDLDWGPVWGGYLGLFLMGGAYLAIGILASTWSEHQLVAFFTALFISLIFFFLNRFLPLLPDAIASPVEYLSFDYHYRNIARGVIDSRNLVFFLSIIGACLLLAFRGLESRKWK